MSHNALNQPLMSQSLGGHNGNQQVMVTGAQVMQFLSTTVSQGGGNSVMAQDVLQLMQQQPTAIVDDITRQMAPVVQLIAPRENQVTSALDRVCVQYQPQIAQQQSARSGQAACTALAKMLSGMPTAQTPEGRLLARQLQQGRLPEDNVTKRQLGQLLEQARGQDASGQVTQLLKQLAKTVPGSRDMVQKALAGEEHRLGDDEQVAASVKEKSNATELPRQQMDKQMMEDIAYPIGQRQGQQQDGSQQHAAHDENDEIVISETGKALRTGLTGDVATASGVDQTEASAAAEPFEGAALALQMACPLAQSVVSEAQADRAVQHVLQNNQVSVISLVQAPLDGLLLQAATLGLKTFSNTADAVAKSIKINGDAQIRLSDKKIADYQDQLALAREQEQQSTKAKLWSAIFSPITTLLNKIFKPMMDLLKKIPGVEQLFNLLKENISEVALAVAIISSLICPMSLPMTLGLLAGTATAAGFSIANKAMGDKAPQWLKITDQVGDMLAGLSLSFSVVGMMGGWSKVGQMAANSLSKVSHTAGRLFNFLGNHGNELKYVTAAFNSFTTLGDGVSQYWIGSQLANSQKEMGYIEASIGLNEAQAKWLQYAQNNAVSNLENILNRVALMSESASKSIYESGSLRARLSNSIV